MPASQATLCTLYIYIYIFTGYKVVACTAAIHFLTFTPDYILLDAYHHKTTTHNMQRVLSPLLFMRASSEPVFIYRIGHVKYGRRNGSLYYSPILFVWSQHISIRREPTREERAEISSR